MFTCFSALQRSTNAKTAVNKHKFVVARLGEGRSTVGWALLSLQPAHFLDLRRERRFRHSLCQLARNTFPCATLRLTSTAHHVWRCSTGTRPRPRRSTNQGRLPSPRTTPSTQWSLPPSLPWGSAGGPVDRPSQWTSWPSTRWPWWTLALGLAPSVRPPSIHQELVLFRTSHLSKRVRCLVAKLFKPNCRLLRFPPPTPGLWFCFVVLLFGLDVEKGGGGRSLSLCVDYSHPHPPLLFFHVGVGWGLRQSASDYAALAEMKVSTARARTQTHTLRYTDICSVCL